MSESDMFTKSCNHFNHFDFFQLITKPQHVDQWMQELDYNHEDVKDSVAAKTRADIMSMVAETESDESDEEDTTEGSARRVFAAKVIRIDWKHNRRVS